MTLAPFTTSQPKNIRLRSKSTPERNEELKIVCSPAEINNKRKQLLEAVLGNAPGDDTCNEHCVFGDLEIFNQEGSFTLNIETGSRTGKPTEAITESESKKRFRTRVTAFKFLSNYWTKSSKFSEKTRRSISPLKCIFDYQEEFIFDIQPCEASEASPVVQKKVKVPPVQIKISELDENATNEYISFGKKRKTKAKPKRKLKKGSSNSSQKAVIDSLSTILSELESEDGTISSGYLSSKKIHHEDFSTSAYLEVSSSKKPRKKTVSKARSKASNSSKVIADNASFLKPAPRRTRTKKSRPASISYGQMSLMGIVKSLDEISTEMESNNTNL
jgi:hypothetical protein